jgi:hypothetical protein
VKLNNEIENDEEYQESAKLSAKLKKKPSPEAKPAQNITPITKAPVPSSSECSPPYEETSSNEIENVDALNR